MLRELREWHVGEIIHEDRVGCAAEKTSLFVLTVKPINAVTNIVLSDCFFLRLITTATVKKNHNGNI